MKKLLFLLLSFAFAFSIYSIDAYADAVWECNGHSYDTLDTLVSTEYPSGGTCEIKLLRNYEVTDSLVFGYSGVDIDLDLNGYNLQCGTGLSDYIIKVNDGNVKIRNTGTGGGMIQGSPGCCGMYISSSGTDVELLAGVSIVGFSGTNGGGVYINGGNLTIDGGKIDSCTAGEKGGGVYVTNSGHLDFKAGIINCCTSNQIGGGVYLTGFGQCILSGTGQIIACSSTGYGGGIYCDSDGNVAFSGGTIKDCMANEAGGGIYAVSGDDILISGTATVINNTATPSDRKNNVYSANGCVTMAGNLNGSVGISGVDVSGGIIAFGKPLSLTSTYSGVDHFFYDVDPSMIGAVNPDNSAQLIFVHRMSSSSSSLDEKDPVIEAIDYAASHDLKAKVKGIATLSVEQLDYLKSKPEVTLVLDYSYKNIDYRIEILGSNVVIEPDVRYYGPLKLYEMYGGTVTTKASIGDLYVIRKGDTLFGIAEKFHMKVKKLLELNPYIQNPDKIYEGKTLKIK